MSFYFACQCYAVTAPSPCRHGTPYPNHPRTSKSMICTKAEFYKQHRHCQAAHSNAANSQFETDPQSALLPAKRATRPMADIWRDMDKGRRVGDNTFQPLRLITHPQLCIIRPLLEVVQPLLEVVHPQIEIV